MWSASSNSTYNLSSFLLRLQTPLIPFHFVEKEKLQRVLKTLLMLPQRPEQSHHFSLLKHTDTHTHPFNGQSHSSNLILTITFSKSPPISCFSTTKLQCNVVMNNNLSQYCISVSQASSTQVLSMCFRRKIKEEEGWVRERMDRWKEGKEEGGAVGEWRQASKCILGIRHLSSRQEIQHVFLKHKNNQNTSLFLQSHLSWEQNVFDRQ